MGARGAYRSSSMVDLDLGKRLLQVLDPILRDLGSLQVKRLQLGQLLDVLQSLMRDFGATMYSFSESSSSSRR